MLQVLFWDFEYVWEAVASKLMNGENWNEFDTKLRFLLKALQKLWPAIKRNVVDNQRRSGQNQRRRERNPDDKLSYLK